MKQKGTIITKLLGLNFAYCQFCKKKRLVSSSKPYFCLSCGYYIKPKKGES